MALKKHKVMDSLEKRLSHKKNIMGKSLRRYFIKASNYAATYIQSSTFHGVNHITLSGNRHWIETAFWLCILVVFGGGTIWTISQSYARYLANPTVITLDKSYRSWNITFPATTFCFVNKLDTEKARQLIKRKWGVEKGAKFDYYMKFLRVVSNSSYNNLAFFEEFKNDKQLLKENLSFLMNEVTFEVENLSLSLFNKRKQYFFKTVLEMGVCYSAAALVSREYAPRINKRKITSNFSLHYEPLYCIFLHLSCYGMAEGFPRDANVYVHSPYEVPITASPFHTLYYTYHMELAYDQFDIKSSSSVRQLHPTQRRCYFLDEPMMKSTKYYSFNTCIMNCRRTLAMRWCNCVPHFYKTEDGESVCSLGQLSCIHKRSAELLALSQKRNETEKVCVCYPACEGSYVMFDYETISKHDLVIQGATILSTRYRWAIEKYSRTRYKRDILFGVEELLVSFGGTACFFLGGSLMSGMELIYFFTVRLIRYLK